MKKEILYLSLCMTIALIALFACRTVPDVKVEEDDTPLTLSEQALDYFNNKEYRAAIAYHAAIISNFSREKYEKEIAWAYYEIGFCYYYMENYETAVEYFDIVINDFSVQAPRTLAQKLKVTIANQQEAVPIETSAEPTPE
jgi:outer membrane protein assembly factor BamD (BamD/ComL family)